MAITTETPIAASDAMLNQLRAANDRFNAGWAAKGKPLTRYTCHRCQCAVQVRQPSGDDDVGEKGFWDSLTICVECGALNFLIVWPDGRTEATNPHVRVAASDEGK